MDLRENLVQSLKFIDKVLLRELRKLYILAIMVRMGVRLSFPNDQRNDGSTTFHACRPSSTFI